MEIGINATVRKAKWEDVKNLLMGKISYSSIGCTVPPFRYIIFVFNLHAFYFYTNNPIASNIAGYNNEQVNSPYAYFLKVIMRLENYYLNK